MEEMIATIAFVLILKGGLIDWCNYGKVNSFEIILRFPLQAGLQNGISKGGHTEPVSPAPFSRTEPASATGGNRFLGQLQK